MDFSVRSNKPELIDRFDLPFEEIKRNMYELEKINSLLGGHRITIRGFQILCKHVNQAENPLLICEIGCGGGDNLFALALWCRNQKLNVSFLGIDINPNCIQYATKKNKAFPVTFIISDYRQVAFEKKPDIIFSSLFCHHFTDIQLVEMMRWLRINSSSGFFINDLHRHLLAYHSIRLLTFLFSKSRLVKNDAPLSVLKGFKRKEWNVLFFKAQLIRYEIHWKWAFRWLVIIKN